MDQPEYRWEPPKSREQRLLLERVEAHVESTDSLGFEVGAGHEVLHFLAGLRDMGAVEALLHGLVMTPQEREWVMNRIEEIMGDLPKPAPSRPAEGSSDGDRRPRSVEMSDAHVRHAGVPGGLVRRDTARARAAAGNRDGGAARRGEILTEDELFRIG